MKKLYDLKKALHAALLILLLSVVGIAKGYAQDFTVDGLNYTINDDGVSVTVSGEFGMSYYSLVIPEAVENDGTNYAVTAIADHAFEGDSGCSLWGELIIPNSIVTIGESAFRGCADLTALTIGNSVAEIGNNAFLYCDGFQGDLVIPNSVTTIGDSAFSGCRGFNGSLTIGHSVVEIGNEAFRYCDGFEGNLVIPNSVITIGNSAFSICRGFTGSLTIGNSVVAIGEWAFQSCDFTGELVIPNSVTTIGAGAFAWCEGFTGELVIPNAVSSISDQTFIGCSGFTGELVIPNSVTTIGAGAFAWCEDFTGLTIGNLVATIGSEAFEACVGFSGALVIPNSVTAIGDYAFSGCNSFTGTVTISSSVNAIGDNIFYLCNNLEHIMVDPENAVYDSRNNCNGIIETATNTLITGCKHTVIPNTVVSIGNYAFGGCNMTSISIPNSVTKLGYGVFNWCSNLTAIVIPSSVTKIDGQQFSGCDNLEKVTVEAENSVYDSRKNCNAIVESGTDVLISGCKNTVIPNTVTVIGNGAFASCNITSIDIPLSVTKIDHDAFTDSDLKGDLVIPNSVVSIEDHAFYRCWYLNGTLVLGNSLTHIGREAFADCNNLHHVISLASNPPALPNYETFGYDGMDQLIVCCGNKDAYEASDWVNCFHTIEEDCNAYSVDVKNSTGGVVSTSVNSARLGEEVLVSYIAEPGYELNSITVCKADDETVTIPCYKNNFVMLNFDVVVKPSFGNASVNEDSNIAVSVYPNPAQGIITIEASDLQRIEVYNSLGQLVESRQSEGDALDCDLSGHEAGIYLIRMETASGIVTKQVVLTK